VRVPRLHGDRSAIKALLAALSQVANSLLSSGLGGGLNASPRLFYCGGPWVQKILPPLEFYRFLLLGDPGGEDLLAFLFSRQKKT